MGDFNYRKEAASMLGVQYERKLVVYLALAACNQKDLKDFWIASNVAGVGDLDDIILYRETLNGKKDLTFIQVKHRLNTAQRRLKVDTIDIPKYVKSIDDIQNLVNHPNLVQNKQRFLKTANFIKQTGVSFENMEFIYLTNCDINVNDVNFSCVPKLTFLNTNPKNMVYKISPSMAESLQKESILGQFFIYANQSGINKDNSLMRNIITELNKFMLNVDFSNIQKLVKKVESTFIKEINKQEQILSLTISQKIISRRILSFLNNHHTGEYPLMSDSNWKIFQKIVKRFQFIVLYEDSSNLQNYYKSKNAYNCIVRNESCIKLVMQCLKFAEDEKVIWLTSKLNDDIVEDDISILQFLNDLSTDELDLISNHSLKIQGRETKFKSLLTKYPDIKNIFDVDDIINSMFGKLCIGKDYDTLNNYVSRSIPRIFVEKSIILNMGTSFFIVIVENNLVKSELNIKSYLKSKLSDAGSKTQTRNNETNKKQINFQCVKRDAVSEAKSNVCSQFNCVHVLKYHKSNIDFLYEWLSSSDNIKEVKHYIVEEECDLKPMGDNLVDICWNTISKLIIMANPGMGKTYLSKYLANNFPVDYWVILLIFSEIDFNKTQNFQSWLEEFHAKNLNAKDKKIYELYMRNKSVVVFFDGFDEVAHENNQKALNFISEAIDERFKIVVTSREVRKVILEDTLNSMAYTLKPFTKDDKQNFLEHFYSQHIKNFDDLDMDVIENRIHDFVSTLLKNFSISNWDEEFTGVPLQCRLLAEGFIQDCQKFCESNDKSKMPINVNLISLYEKFIDTKFDINWKEKEGIVTKDKNSYEKVTELHRNYFLSNHMDAAVQIIFTAAEIKISDEFLEEIKIAKEKHGIIVGIDGNNNPIFVHRTFAEYFAAKWLVDIKEGKKQFGESKREEYLKFLLKPEFNFVRDLFDRIVCKQCELHTAVLNADLSKVRDIFEKNGKRDEGKCGRNALHLISARGARHEVENQWMRIEREGEEKYLEILEFLLENGDWREEKEKVLRMTPQQFADHRKAVGVIDRLCRFNNQLYNLKNSFIKKWNKKEILKMCCKYDYSNIVMNFLDSKTLELYKIEELLEICAENDSFRFAEKVIKSKELNSQHLPSMIYNYGGKGTLLHIAARNGSAKILDDLLKFMDVNIKDKKGRTPLYVGCSEGYLSVVKSLVEKGGNLFLRNKYGSTPMDYAVHSENRELVDYVTSYDVLKIGFGEDINAPLDEKNGQSALHYASMGKNMSTLERLLTEKAIVNITDNQGNTALHLISDNKYFVAPIACRLIESGLNIDAKNFFGETTLHRAAFKGNKECMELLLQCGANPNIVDYEQRTPLSLTREGRNKEIFLLLWDKTEEKLKSERDVLHKSVLTDLDKEEVRKTTFSGYPEELLHIVDLMSQAGLYYYGVDDEVICFSCECWLLGWEPSDNPWVKHAKDWMAENCQFLIQEKGKDFIESCGNRKY